MASNTEKRTVEIIMDGRQPSSTMKALTADINTLKKSLRGLEDGKEFDAQAAKLRQLQGEYDHLNNKIKSTGLSLEYFKNQFKAVALGFVGGSIVTSIGATLSNKIVQTVTHLTNLSDELAGVRKSTNLSAEAVDEFNQRLDELDTRTQKTALRDIATGLGQIGQIGADTPLDDMLAKVQAIDKVVVSLGDEFGDNAKEITTQISILRNNLADFKTDDFADDVLKIGNALNVLGATGLATAPIVTDFATRMSGVLQGFNVTTPQILGLSAAMQELGIDVERGATAVTQSIQKMTKNPEVFAKVAGAKTKKEIKEFVDLVNKDAFAAFLKVAKGAQTAGSSNTIFAQILDDLGVDGARASEVISKLGQSSELVTDRINDTADAVKNYNSINQEFAVLNDNNAAKIEKLKKTFVALAESDSFNKLLTRGINATIAFVRWIQQMAGWVDRNIWLFKAIGATVLAYVASIKLATIWQARKIALDKIEAFGVNLVVGVLRLMTGELTLAMIAQRLFNATALKNPYLLIATAIIGATTALAAYINKQKELAKQKITETYDAEIKKLMKLNEKTLQELDKQFPDPSKLVKSQIEANTKAIDQSIQKQREKIVSEAAKTKKLLDEQQKEMKTVDVVNYRTEVKGKKVVEKDDLDKERDKKSLQLATTRTKNEQAVLNKLLDIRQNYVDRKKEISDYEIEQDEAAKKKLLEQQEKFNEQLKQILNDVQNAKIEAIEEEDIREQEALKKDKADKDKAINQEIDAAIQLAKELKKGTAVISKLQYDRHVLLTGNEAKFQREYRELINKQTKESAEESFKKDIEAVHQKFDAEKLLTKQLYADGLITKEQYEFKLQDIDRLSKTELLEITKRYGKNVNDLQQAIADIDIKIAEDRTEKIKRALINEAEVRVRMANLKVNSNKTNRLDALKEQYDAETDALIVKLATEAGITELNEEKILQIKKQFADQFAELDAEYSEARKQNIQSIVDSSLNAFAGIFDAILEGTRGNIQAQMDLLQQQTDAELAALEDKKNKKLLYEDEYAIKKDEINKKSAAKERELKRKMAIQDKIATIFQIGLSTSQAVMNALASVPFPANLAFAALAGVMGAIQLGFAASKPIPYAKGGIPVGPSHDEGGLPIINPKTGEVVAEVEGGEPFLSKETYANNREIVDALLYSGRYNDGRKIKIPAYYNSTPTFAYGGVLDAYRTTTLARAGIMPGNSSNTTIVNNGNPDLLSLVDVVERLNKKLDEPMYGVWDFDYHQKSLAIIDSNKKIGNVG